MSTRIALAQINTTVGDFAGNVARLVAAAQEAHALGARLMVAPELALSGYPPEDLLLRPTFFADCEAALAGLCTALQPLAGLQVLVGHPYRRNVNANAPFARGLPPREAFNAVSLIVEGAVAGRYFKQELPNGEVFDEKRYFASDPTPFVFDIDGIRFGVLIGEDAWHRSAALLSQAAGAQVLLVPNASPYHLDKVDVRVDVVRQRIRETGLPVVYVNAVGAQDELVFDGGSFVLDGSGEYAAQFAQFVEKVGVLDLDGGRGTPLIAPGATLTRAESLESQVYRALVLGVRDYVGKNGFPGAIVGLSGGVDSALVLAIACDALGAERVRAVMLPSRFTSEMSRTDAQNMAMRLGVQYDIMDIEPIVQAFSQVSSSVWAGIDADLDATVNIGISAGICNPAPARTPQDKTAENIQSRVRGTLLMGISNRSGAIVLTAANKSDLAVGYCTLYGDMAGGFAVIKDISKTLVYRLCHYRNGGVGSGVDIIPDSVLTRPPSAELRQDQTDLDDLPPYDALDAIMRMYMEEDRSPADIVAMGFSQQVVDCVTQLIKSSEYKRRQAPIGIRVTPRAFGRDWRYPVTSRYVDRVKSGSQN